MAKISDLKIKFILEDKEDFLLLLKKILVEKITDNYGKSFDL